MYYYKQCIISHNFHFHDISSALLNIYTVTKACILLELLRVSGERGTHFASQHPLPSFIFLCAVTAHCLLAADQVSDFFPCL